jgi:hypothetical protein
MWRRPRSEEDQHARRSGGARVVVAISLFQLQIDLFWVAVGISAWFDRSD